MANYNRVILLGNLTRDPELRYIPNGTPVVEFGLAVSNRRQTPSGEWVDEPVFVDIVLWRRLAEIASEYLTKGSPVLIEGRLKMDTWTTSDGQKRSKLRVLGERMQLLGSRAGEAEPAASQPPAPGKSQPTAPERSYEPTYEELPPEDSYPDDVPF
ncbi:MAG: single-stranded DNA-binding protein [Thermoguttaceae bacterium]|nr:single-stranded DNA-binding protein [Thermoguttaceae bacterium]MDW8038132.1 single-stranded DNA-binding protein [Thermoguttaceae bacterium]